MSSRTKGCVKKSNYKAVRQKGLPLGTPKSLRKEYKASKKRIHQMKQEQSQNKGWFVRFLERTIEKLEKKLSELE